MSWPPEPRIEINGVLLNEGEAMTVRVALSAFATELNDRKFVEALGPIGPRYVEAMRWIFAFIQRGPR